MAVLWLKWASFLAQKQPESKLWAPTLVVFGTQRITPEQWVELRDAAQGLIGRFTVVLAHANDEDEGGYPRSATHLFIRALEFCNENYPGVSALWMETDCFPVAPDWFDAVHTEYAYTDKPFMGVYVEHVFPHMAGCGIYPPDWKKRAPLIEATMNAPDLPEMYGEGKGQAWDAFAGSQTIPQMHRSTTIQQIWRPSTFTTENIARVLPTTKLFHQCKNGSLIATLSKLRYPEFLQLPASKQVNYMMFSSKSTVVIADTEVAFKPCARGPGGCLFSVFQPRNVMEEAVLAGACGKRGITQISNDDFNSLIRQSNLLRL